MLRPALLLCLAATPILAEEPSPKLGPNAVPITQDTEYLRSHPAPDYWAFAPFVRPQFTNAACTVASVAGALSGLDGLPPDAEDTILSQPELLKLTGDAEWTRVTQQDGDGATFEQFVGFTEEAIKALDRPYTLTTFHPAAADAAAGAEMRRLLEENERSAEDALIVVFNQGVVTGDWDGPHASVIGAYDKERDRVLILEVDQEWYIPYWTPADVLLQALVKPAPPDQGVLAGMTGGFLRIARSS